MLVQIAFRDASALTISVLFLLICSCSRNSSKNSLRPGPAMSRFVHFELAVYLPPAQDTIRSQPMQALSESLRHYPGLKLVSVLPKEPQTMLVRANLNDVVKDRYAPPS